MKLPRARLIRGGTITPKPARNVSAVQICAPLALSALSILRNPGGVDTGIRTRYRRAENSRCSSGGCCEGVPDHLDQDLIPLSRCRRCAPAAFPPILVALDNLEIHFVERQEAGRARPHN